MITGRYPSLRLRRNRKSNWSRKLIQENTLSPSDFILPIFLIDGSNKKESIKSMPNVYRYTINRLAQIIDKAIHKGIPMVALFPKTKNRLKDEIGSESLNKNNLVCKAIIEIKKRYKDQIGIMCDVALDPYTSHGHDGLIKSNQIINLDLSKDDLRKPYEELIKKKDYDELRVFRHDSKKDIKADDNLWNNFNKHLRKLDVYSFESARKSFNTTARILGIEEGIKKTLIAQTDHSIQRHYDNYNDPELVTKVQLAHLRIMHHFKIIELYELWLRKIEELFGAQNSDLFVGESSDFVYRDQLKRLEGILKIDRTKISKDPFWIERF